MSKFWDSLQSFRPSHLAHALALTAGFVSLSAPFAVAGQRSDGSLFFDHAPRLIRTETGALPMTYVAGTRYEFTITVPSDAGAPLQAVTIAQEPSSRAIAFEINQSRAIAANGTNITLTSLGGAKANATTIAFAQPIQPGETVTISLKADRNPNSEGIYLFGVTAYPVGDQSNGLFLGYGRVRVYSHGG